MNLCLSCRGCFVAKSFMISGVWKASDIAAWIASCRPFRLSTSVISPKIREKGVNMSARVCTRRGDWKKPESSMESASAETNSEPTFQNSVE